MVLPTSIRVTNIQQQRNFLVKLLVLTRDKKMRKASPLNIDALPTFYRQLSHLAEHFNIDCKYWPQLRKQTKQFSSQNILRENCHTLIFITVYFCHKWRSENTLYFAQFQTPTWLNQDFQPTWSSSKAWYGYQRFSLWSYRCSWQLQHLPESRILETLQFFW